MSNKQRVKTFAALTLALGGLMGAPAHAGTGALERVDAPVAFFAAAAQLEGQLNINDATAEQWELLPGIGPVTAERIVDYASKRPFADPLHLLRVKGIGRKTYAKIKPFLTIDGPTTLHVVK